MDLTTLGDSSILTLAVTGSASLISWLAGRYTRSSNQIVVLTQRVDVLNSLCLACALAVVVHDA